MGVKTENCLMSHVRGPDFPAVLECTIGQALDQAAERWPDNDALIDRGQDIRLNWRDLHERATGLASGFLAMGLLPGDRIGIWSLNRYEWALTLLISAES